MLLVSASLKFGKLLGRVVINPTLFVKSPKLAERYAAAPNPPPVYWSSVKTSWYVSELTWAILPYNATESQAFVEKRLKHVSTTGKSTHRLPYTPLDTS